MNTRKLNRAIFVLSIIGIVIAVYVLQSFLRDAPIVCLNTGCELVRKNPASYLLGIPVPAFGLIGYSAIAVLAFGRTVSNNRNLLNAIFAISLFGVAFVSWFTYAELFVIQAVCTWCALSAGNMLLLFALSAKSMLLSNKET